MADFLLELRSEELPAGAQPGGASALRQAMQSRLREAGIPWEEDEVFWTPRRLALIIRGLPPATRSVREERRGPRTSAPDRAIDGFARSAGLDRNTLEIRGEGDDTRYFAVVESPAQPIAEWLGEAAPAAIRAVRWPKSMRWGRGSLRWSRPLRAIVSLVTIDEETREVPFEFEGVTVGANTAGHPFLSPDPFAVRSVAEYREQLRATRVLLDPAERRQAILDGVRAYAGSEGLEAIEDPGLVEENANLTEWPVVIGSRIDTAFSGLPGELLRVSLRVHQRFQVIRESASGRVCAFAAVADNLAADGGERIRAGYQRVLRARLSDANYFWTNDRKRGLATMAQRLDALVYHASLGSIAERSGRLVRLASKISGAVGADAALAARAAGLCKADLVSETVTEFPALQGTVGGLLAEQAGEPRSVCEAIAGQYRPMGPRDAPPAGPVAATVAVADRAEMLYGFFAVGIRPSGSKDPYALRRAAIALIRILIENDIRLSLGDLASWSAECFADHPLPESDTARQAVVAFVLERLRVHLRERGFAHDRVAAILAGGQEDDPARAARRVEALATFLDTDPGADDLLSAYRRCRNILVDEGIDGGIDEPPSPDPSRFCQPEESALADAVDAVEPVVAREMAEGHFESALTALSGLRTPVDAFFEHVTVNDSRNEIRENRLRQLARVRHVMERVALFAEIEG